MNVTELARQLKTTREELLEELPKLGFDIGARAIKIDNASAERIKQAWSCARRTERLKEKMQSQEKADSSQALAKKDGEYKEIAISGKISVNDLASKLGVGVTRLMGYLMKNGIMAALNEQIDFETASIIAEDYGFKAVKKEEKREDSSLSYKALRELKQSTAEDKSGKERPPVVVVMGHVDHGKTTLLDAIRKTNVVEGESGGITQHIGAYQVEEKGRLITFLDTPGHEAFKSMRERGGQVADVAILVVAADDGLKPQTLESINVIQKEGLPFVVAINKIDKPGADVDRVKKELAEINLNPEDWGGKTICVPVSAKNGEGVHDLLDMIVLVSDIEKFTADPNKKACGVIIESHVDMGEGPVATVLVHVGTLRLGDEVVIGDAYGKIKALKDWTGSNVSQAPPSMPVKILGLKSTPRVGDILRVEEIDRAHRKKSTKRHRLIDIEIKRGASQEEKEDEKKAKKSVFNIIIKADVLGSLEAFIASVKKFEKDDIAITIIKQGLGNITESDLTLAEDSKAVVYGFNVLMSSEAQKMSYSRSVDIVISRVIYELLDDISNRLRSFIKVRIVEVEQGEVSVLKVFKDSKDESIIGGRVKNAAVTDKAKFRLIRNGEPVNEGKVVELQKNKVRIDSARQGDECGVKVSGVRGIKEGDTLSFFVEEER